jgi:hypothetical protein
MPRTSNATTKCKYCHRISADDSWIRERRGWPVEYRLSICSHCVVSDSERFRRSSFIEFPKGRTGWNPGIIGPFNGPGAGKAWPAEEEGGDADADALSVS